MIHFCYMLKYLPDETLWWKWRNALGKKPAIYIGKLLAAREPKEGELQIRVGDIIEYKIPRDIFKHCGMITKIVNDRTNQIAVRTIGVYEDVIIFKKYVTKLIFLRENLETFWEWLE